MRWQCMGTNAPHSQAPAQRQRQAGGPGLAGPSPLSPRRLQRLSRPRDLDVIPM